MFQRSAAVDKSMAAVLLEEKRIVSIRNHYSNVGTHTEIGGLHDAEEAVVQQRSEETWSEDVANF